MIGEWWSMSFIISHRLDQMLTQSRLETPSKRAPSLFTPMERQGYINAATAEWSVFCFSMLFLNLFSLSFCENILFLAFLLVFFSCLNVEFLFFSTWFDHKFTTSENAQTLYSWQIIVAFMATGDDPIS